MILSKGSINNMSSISHLIPDLGEKFFGIFYEVLIHLKKSKEFTGVVPEHLLVLVESFLLITED